MKQSSSWEAYSHTADQENSPPFMKPEGSLLCSERPARFHYVN